MIVLACTTNQAPAIIPIIGCHQTKAHTISIDCQTMEPMMVWVVTGIMDILVSEQKEKHHTNFGTLLWIAHSISEHR